MLLNNGHCWFQKVKNNIPTWKQKNGRKISGNKESDQILKKILLLDTKLYTEIQYLYLNNKALMVYTFFIIFIIMLADFNHISSSAR